MPGPAQIETIEERARRRAREAAKKREELGMAAAMEAAGRTAEVPAEATRQRTDFTPQEEGEEHPPTILIGTTAASPSPATQIGPQEQILGSPPGALKKKAQQAKPRYRIIIGE